MTTPIDIPIVLKGLPEAKAAIKSLHDSLLKLETDITKNAEAQSKKRIKTLQDEAKQRDKIAKSVHEDMDRATGGGSRRSLGSIKTGVTNPSFAGGAGNIDFSGMAKMATFAGGVGLALGVLKGGLDMATEGLKQFGNFLLTDIVKPQFELETFATQLENSTNGQVKAQQLMDVSNSMQAKWNVNAMEAAKAVSDLTDATGDGKMAMEMIDTFAQLNKGYGVDMQQLSGLTSAMYKEGMSIKDVKQMLGTQLAQGQVTGGKFTLKQIAGLGGEFTKSTASLAGNSDFQMAELGAALQTGGIAGKADTSMNNLNKFIEETSTGKLGGNIAKGGIVGDLGDAIRAALVQSGGDSSKFKGMGYSDSAIAFIKQYSGKFAEELKKNGGNLDAAAKATTATLEEMRNAVANEATIKEAANKTMQTSGEKWDHAINTIKDKLLDVMPAIIELVDSLTEHAPEIAEAALTIAQVMVKVAEVMAKIFGISSGKTDAKTELKFNPETGKFEYQKQKGVNPLDQMDPLKNTTGKITPLKLPDSYKPNEKPFSMTDGLVPSSVVKDFGPPVPEKQPSGTAGLENAVASQIGNFDKSAKSADLFAKALDRARLSQEAVNDRSKPINER